MLKTIIYLIIILATVFYALPRIDLYTTSIEELIFNLSWLLFALFIIGAQIDQMLMIDEEKRVKNNRLKRYKIQQKEKKIWQQQVKKNLVSAKKF